MTIPDHITIDLLADTSFSRGESAPGSVDVEIEHDDLGLPCFSGKTLRGLMRDSWLAMASCFPQLCKPGLRVWGPVGDLEEISILRLGDAQVQASVREWMAWAEHRNHHPLSAPAVLEALTDIRSQTSEERSTGAPAKSTLRSVRVALRGLRLVAPLTWIKQPEERDLRCLALSVLGTRHIGLGRNRGRGFVRLLVNGDRDLTKALAKGNNP
jgi:hypothetical protein